MCSVRQTRCRSLCSSTFVRPGGRYRQVWTFTERLSAVSLSGVHLSIYRSLVFLRSLGFFAEMNPQFSAPVQPAQACMNVMNNTVVVSQPGGCGNALLLIGKDKLQFRSWTSGICSCLNDCTSCLLGTMCLPVLLCRVSNRLNECALVTCCVPGGFLAMRTKLRTMGGIRGSICSDCIMTTCCYPCSACQMSREQDSMGL